MKNIFIFLQASARYQEIALSLHWTKERANTILKIYAKFVYYFSRWFCIL